MFLKIDSLMCALKTHINRTHLLMTNKKNETRVVGKTLTINMFNIVIRNLGENVKDRMRENKPHKSVY